MTRVQQIPPSRSIKRWWVPIGYMLSVLLVLQGLAGFGPSLLLGLDLFVVILLTTHAHELRASVPPFNSSRRWLANAAYIALVLVLLGPLLFGVAWRSSSGLIPLSSPAALPSSLSSQRLTTRRVGPRSGPLSRGPAHPVLAVASAQGILGAGGGVLAALALPRDKPYGRTNASLQTITVTVPAGAVGKATTLHLSAAVPWPLTFAVDGAMSVSVALSLVLSATARTGPAVSNFGRPLVLQLGYGPTLSRVVDPATLVIAFYDSPTHTWKALPTTVDTESHLLIAAASRPGLFEVRATTRVPIRFYNPVARAVFRPVALRLDPSPAPPSQHVAMTREGAVFVIHSPRETVLAGSHDTLRVFGVPRARLTVIYRWARSQVVYAAVFDRRGYAAAAAPAWTAVTAPPWSAANAAPQWAHVEAVISYGGRTLRYDDGFLLAPRQALNPIQRENSYSGSTDWQDNKRTTQGHLVEGYAGATSVDVGKRIDLYVNVAPAARYTLEFFRMGWYQGLGARLMLSASVMVGRTQPRCPVATVTGLVRCAWARSFSLRVPRSWTTGVYLVRLTRADGYQNHIIFVVRDDHSRAPYYFQSSVTTFEAYNLWGGRSLYGDDGATQHGSPLRAYQVSFDRPYTAGFAGPYEFLKWEYPMVRWMERQGYDVAYATDVDTDLSPVLLLHHRAFLSIGHDEYWSKAMRSNVEAALAHGVNLAFLGANAMYWNIRFARSPLGRDRVIVCYKDAQLDPLYNKDNTNVTVRWSDAPLNKPENAVIGEMSSSIVPHTEPGVPFIVGDARAWVYRGVDVETHSSLPNVVGYEYDHVVDNGFTPRGLTILSQSPLTDYQGRKDVANATVYTVPSGATVFAAGTIQWADSLDNFNYRGTFGTVSALDSRVQDITTNVLVRLGQKSGAPPYPPLSAPASTNAPGHPAHGAIAIGVAPWRVVVSDWRSMGAVWSTNVQTRGSSASIDFSSSHGLTTGAPLQLVQTITAFHVMPGHANTIRFWGSASTMRTVVVTVRGTTHGVVLARAALTLAHAWQNFEFTVPSTVNDSGVEVAFSLDTRLTGHVRLDGVELMQ